MKELTICYYENNERVDTQPFVNFNEAVGYCEEVFGLNSIGWNDIKETNDIEELYHFLNKDGVEVYID